MELLTGITATLELPSILGSGSNLPRPRVLAAYNNVDWVLFPHYTAAGSQQYGVLQCAAVSQKRDDVIIATAPLRLRPATKSMTAVLLRNQSSLFACLWPCSSNRVTFLCVCLWLTYWNIFMCWEKSFSFSKSTNQQNRSLVAMATASNTSACYYVTNLDLWPPSDAGLSHYTNWLRA